MTTLQPRERRPWLVAGAVGAVLVVVAACGQAAPSGSVTPAGGASTTGGAPQAGGAGTTGATAGDVPTATQTVHQGDVTLTATLTIGFAQYPVDPGIRRRPGLVVEYALTNSGTRQLVAYDRVPDSLGSATLPPDLDPEHAWVYMDAGLVRVSKQGFATAPGVAFIAAPVTGARALAPGSTLTGRAYAVSPPELDVPGPDFAAPRTPIDPAASQTRFCVQVGERSPQMRPSSAQPGVLEAPVTAPSPGELLCTDAVPLLTP